NAVDDAWDFKRQEPYTPDNYREALEIKLTAIQNDLNQRFGKFPALYANNMKSKVYYPGHGEVKKLLEPTNIKPRPLDGFSVESFAGSFAAKAAKRDENGPKYIGPNAWRDNVKMVMDAAQAGAAALPMIANAGVKSELLEKAGPIRDKFELFAYASYLMAVEANGKRCSASRPSTKKAASDMPSSAPYIRWRSASHWKAANRTMSTDTGRKGTRAI
ncbi:MAG: hypothetical protein K0R75_1922, partial [Paenibacillaceae bacterium]|nr:hypothetical protein [Paenibacillaceae bacterium]